MWSLDSSVGSAYCSSFRALAATLAFTTFASTAAATTPLGSYFLGKRTSSRFLTHVGSISRIAVEYFILEHFIGSPLGLRLPKGATPVPGRFLPTPE